MITTDNNLSIPGTTKVSYTRNVFFFMPDGQAMILPIEYIADFKSVPAKDHHLALQMFLAEVRAARPEIKYTPQTRQNWIYKLFKSRTQTKLGTL